jgi:hypothetical protein
VGFKKAGGPKRHTDRQATGEHSCLRPGSVFRINNILFATFRENPQAMRATSIAILRISMYSDYHADEPHPIHACRYRGTAGP